jgi:hypothetical protein
MLLCCAKLSTYSTTLRFRVKRVGHRGMRDHVESLGFDVALRLSYVKSSNPKSRHSNPQTPNRKQAALDHISKFWLKPNGTIIASIDCYWENRYESQKTLLALIKKTNCW